MVLINKFTFAQSIQTGDNKIVFAGGMESMSCSRHCIHARPGVKFGDVSMEDTLLKVGQILGKVRRYIYSRKVGYWGRFGDVFAQDGLYTREYLEIYFLLFTQGGLDTRESLKIYLFRVVWMLGKIWRFFLVRMVCILGNIWRYIFYLLRVCWILGKVWRYIFFEWVGYQGRFGDIFKYLLRVGWILGKICRFINSMWVGFNGKFEYQFNLREPLLKQPQTIKSCLQQILFFCQYFIYFIQYIIK